MLEHLALRWTPNGTRSRMAGGTAAEVGASATKSEQLTAFDATGPASCSKRPLHARRRKAETFSSILEGKGGRNLNASTTQDYTHFSLRLPWNMAELWFRLEADRLAAPRIRGLEQERHVVLEERAIKENQPLFRLMEGVKAAAFRAHPYGRPVIGTRTDITNLTTQTLKQFALAQYVPGRMICVAVGDLNPNQACDLAERYFGRLLPKSIVDDEIATEPDQDRERRVVVGFPCSEAILVAHRRPGADDPANPTYELMGALLSLGASARLRRRLVEQSEVAARISASPAFPGRKLSSLFAIAATPRPGVEKERLLDGVVCELERLTIESVSVDELNAAKRRLLFSLAQESRNSVTLAGQLAAYQALTGHWRNFESELERVCAVQPEDIQRIARSIFRASNRIVGFVGRTV